MNDTWEAPVDKETAQMSPTNNLLLTEAGMIATDYRRKRMVLVDAQGKKVNREAIYKDFRGTAFRVCDARAPHKPGSVGHVEAYPLGQPKSRHEYYVSVFNMRWIEEVAA